MVQTQRSEPAADMRHICDICGREGHWSPLWSWYESILDEEDVSLLSKLSEYRDLVRRYETFHAANATEQQCSCRVCIDARALLEARA